MHHSPPPLPARLPRRAAAALALGAALALPVPAGAWGFPAHRLVNGKAIESLWADRLDPARPGHDRALAARLRPFADEALGLADAWVGAIARRLPKDAALAVAGDAPGGLLLLRGRGVAEGHVVHNALAPPLR